MGWWGPHCAGSLDDFQARLLVLKLPVTTCNEKPWLNLLNQFGSKSIPSTDVFRLGGYRYRLIRALPYFSAIALAPPSSTWGFFSGQVPSWSQETQQDVLVYRSRGRPHLLPMSKETSQRPQQTYDPMTP